jgi:flagellar biosynthetic protein FliQ
MQPQDAIDLGREALVIATLISAPVLVAGMFVGLIVGLIQALTQIQCLSSSPWYWHWDYHYRG